MISAVNWGEVFYSLVKRMGLGKTETLMAELQQNVPLSVVGVTPEDAVSAARLKAQYNLPYADAFAAALTGTQRVLVTADVSHFERVPKLRLLKVATCQESGRLILGMRVWRRTIADGRGVAFSHQGRNNSG